jgi:ribonuclease HI
MTSPGRLILSCDGACSGNPGPGGWGVIVIFPEGRVLELGGGEPGTTNNRMELAGAIAALAAVADRPEPATLYTDSSYVLQGITSWIAGWKRRGWVTFEGKPVLNKDLWTELDAIAAARRGRLQWKQVRGHCGHELNERCDQIAVAYSKRMPIDLYDGPAVGCGYSLLEPDEKQLRAPSSGPRKASGSKKKGGFYVSVVDGVVERHTVWPDCARRVLNVKGAKFKKVADEAEASEVLERWGAKA